MRPHRYRAWFVAALAFALLATASIGCTSRSSPTPTRYNVRSGEKVVGSGRDLGGNVYAPGGIYYAAGSHAGRGIDVRDWETGEQVYSVHHGAGITSISWSPDGRSLASLATDGTIVVWQVSG